MMFMFLFRNVLGTRNLSEILSEREEIGESMHRSLVGYHVFPENGFLSYLYRDK